LVLESEKKQKKQKKPVGERIRGSINVFVAIMLIPTVAFTGFMVDFARIRMMGAQVHNAADLGASSAISYYDGLLKDVYGLFAVSQDGKAEKFVVDYVRSSLGLGEDGKKEAKSFNLVGTGSNKINVSTKYTVNEDYSLRNTAYFQQQVGQYMKYRVAFSLMDIFGIFMNNKSVFEDEGDKAKNGQEFVEEDFGEELLELYQEISDSYEELYDLIVEIQTFNIDPKGRPAINAEISKAENALTNIMSDNENKSSVQTSALNGRTAMDNARKTAKEYPDKFAKITSVTKKISDKTKKFEQVAQEKLAMLRTPGRYSEEFSTKMTEQINELRNTLIDADTLTSASNSFVSANKPKFDDQFKQLEHLYYMFDELKKTADSHDKEKNPVLPLAGGWLTYTFASKRPAAEVKYVDSREYSIAKDVRLWITGISTWHITVPDVNVQQYESGAFEMLKEWAEAEKSGSAKEAKQRNKDIKEQNKKDKEELDKEVKNSSGKKIPDEFWKAWKNDPVSKESRKVSDNFLDNIVNRVLLMEFGMQDLTNYITNKKYLDDGKQVKDEMTVSGIPKSSKMNYLFKYEMEYVALGLQQGNFEAFVAIMSAIFFVANYLFTFTGQCAVLEGVIQGLRAIPFVGFVIAEVFRVVAAVAETVWDVASLFLRGKKASIIKGTTSWWFLNPGYDYTNWEKGGMTRANLGLYYDEYLRLFIMFNVIDAADGNKGISSRLMNIVELNMNHYKNGSSGTPKRNKFFAEKAYVIVDVTVEASMPYFFIPMPFITNPATAQGSNVRAYEFKGITKTRGY
jgi:hypothetical protein